MTSSHKVMEFNIISEFGEIKLDLKSCFKKLYSKEICILHCYK